MAAPIMTTMAIIMRVSGENDLRGFGLDFFIKITSLKIKGLVLLLYRTFAILSIRHCHQKSSPF